MGVRARAIGMALLVALLATGCEERGQAALMQLIGELGHADDQEVLLLLERLENGSQEERAVAAWALGEVGRAEGVPLLRSILRDKSDDHYVRLNACTALGRFDGEEVQASLELALGQDDLELQTTALRALSRPEFSGAAEAVAAVITDGNAELKALGVETLSEMLDPANLPVFERLAREDPDKGVRAVAVFSLGKLRDPRAIPTLTGMLEDEAWEVRANAAQALAMIGDRSAAQALRGMLDDEHTQVVLAAERALERLGAAPGGGS